MTVKKRDCRQGLLVGLGEGDVGRQRNWVERNVEVGTRKKTTLRKGLGHTICD